MSRQKQKKEKRLTAKQYARRKGISIRTVYRHIKAGIIEVDQPKPGYPYEIIVYV